MAMKDVTQKDDISCGYYAGFAVSVVNKAGEFSPELPMTKADVEAARSKVPNPKTYLMPEGAPAYLNEILKVEARYGNSDSRMVRLNQVRNFLKDGKALMLGTQSHWIALVGLADQYTATVYNPAGKGQKVIDIFDLGMIGHWPYLVHPVPW